MIKYFYKSFFKAMHLLKAKPKFLSGKKKRTILVRYPPLIYLVLIKDFYTEQIAIFRYHDLSFFLSDLLLNSIY